METIPGLSHPQWPSMNSKNYKIRLARDKIYPRFNHDKLL